MSSVVISTLLAWLVVAWVSRSVVVAQDDGEWSPWSTYGSSCSASCGGGTQRKIRLCNSPTPKNGGQECEKEDGSRGSSETKEIECNVINCYAGTYTQWNLCDNCTNGISWRLALCGPNEEDVCVGKDFENQTQECTRWDKDNCPDPCKKVGNDCPQFGICENLSTDQNPVTKCKCVMGYVMDQSGEQCIRPPPTRPTERPIPTLPPVQKVVATVVSKTASTVLIIFVSLTLGLFLFLRVFTPDRVIQMNMEIALLCAHLFLMFPSTTYETPGLCKVVSMAIHFFFTACFSFMMLEAVHMYSLVAYVVRKDGMCSRLQYVITGWGLAVIIVSVCIFLEHQNYGGEYHCWLQIDTGLCSDQFIAFLMFTVVTIALIESAGQENYAPLNEINKKQRTSAKISQRSNLIILCFVIAHMSIGMFSEYEQNLGLYGVFSILNGITGVLVFFFHCSSNAEVRTKLSSLYKSSVGGGII